jgi:glycyl-tRNA synthetase beta chain
MDEMKPLLVELGVEELPIDSVDRLAKVLENGLRTALGNADIAMGEPEAVLGVYATPRRLVAYFPAVAARQADGEQRTPGPAVAVALDAAGRPTPALLGFAAKLGVAVEALQREAGPKGERFVHVARYVGQPLSELLPKLLDAVANTLPITRSMRWGAHPWSFVRPLRWLVVLHGDQVIEMELFGVHSARHSRGHRFHHDKPVWIADADAYAEALLAAKVIADTEARRRRIRGEVERMAAQLGGMPQMDDALLEQIANLTEWPVAIGCSFDEAFLEVPQEALISTMVANQKFVPLIDANGRLLPRFIGVANIDSKDATQIRHGYERVIRPRFADARFFYEEDLKTPLATHQQALATVTYQPGLGSLWDKSLRVAELARLIAGRVHADAAQAAHAASLAKCDLLTRMVGEFPELQGIMGRTYALAQGESSEIARALDEVYQPRGAGDAIAASALGRVLAVAERADTLAGLFAIGNYFGGNKDPYSLRRTALGLARTLIEGGLQLDTRGLLLEALDAIPEAALAAGLKVAKIATALDVGTRRTALAEEIERFILERLRGYYAEQDIAAGVFEAVLAVTPSSLLDFDRRLRAVLEFTRRAECATLVAANKRVANILRKQAEVAGGVAATVNPALFEDPAERALAEALAAARHASTGAVATRDYAGALTHLAALDTPLARFFEEVMVVAEDPAVRGNRLALLGEVKAAFNTIADLARL